MVGATPFECPVCRLPLCGGEPSHTVGTIGCAAGHSFDVAKEGYVNLLPAQHRTRGLEGDTAEMLRARRRFLEAGHYRPLLGLLAEKVHAALAEDDETARTGGHADDGVSGRRCPRVVLDVGCGEGYYLGGVAEACRASGHPSPQQGALPREGADEVQFLGMDLSKSAVRMAAKRYPSLSIFVADVNRRIYVADATVDVLLNVFSPRNPTEFARVVRPWGRLVVAIPDASHLATVRERLGLLDIEADKEAKVLAKLEPAFRLEDRTVLRLEMCLTPDEVADLVAMGPNRWHGKAAEGAGSGSSSAEAVFVVLTLRRSW